MIQTYNRAAAVAYAHRWAYGRNPAFYDYSGIGGDCTNFVSQCILAGGGVMNNDPTYGWYYVNANVKAPAWTAASYFARFMIRNEATVGPFCRQCSMENAEPGDVIQLSFTGEQPQHSLIVVAILEKMIFAAAHSADADFRPINSYSFQLVRCLHVEGIRII